MEKQTELNIVLELVFFAIVLFLIGWLIYTYQVIFGPLIIASLLAYLLYPSVTWLSKRTKINRRLIVIIVYLVFISFILWALVYLAPILVKQIQGLTGQISNLPEQMRVLEDDLENWLGFSLPIDEVAADLSTDIGLLLQPERAFRIILNATTNIVWLAVIFVTSFHLLRDWERLREWIFSLLPAQIRPEYQKLHQEVKKVWRSYLRGQLLIMFLLGLLSGIGAAAIGLPNSLLLGFLAGTLALIPNLGPTIATGIAALVAWTQGSSSLQVSNLTVTLLVVAIFQIVQAFEGFFLTPRIMGRRMNLHPGIVMVAIVGTLFTLGTLVALIIVPIIGSIMIVVGFVYRKRAGLDPWPDDSGPDDLDNVVDDM